MKHPLIILFMLVALLIEVVSYASGKRVAGNVAFGAIIGAYISYLIVQLGG